MNLETKITIYKFTPQVFTLTPVLPVLLLTSVCCPSNSISRQELPLLYIVY